MKIGIDISVLQTGHRMRGIGSTLINFIKNIPSDEKNKHDFVFYFQPTEDLDNPLDLLDLSGINYTVRSLKSPKQYDVGLPGPLNMVFNAGIRFFQLRKNILFGDDRLNDLKDIDYFLQFDQNRPLPARHKVKSAIIAYDIIPYVLEADYLWSYSTARARGCSMKGALRFSLARYFYKINTRAIMRKAHRLLAISEHTKNDLVNYMGLNPDKISICLLGVDLGQKHVSSNEPKFNRYVLTSWGNVPQPIRIEKTKFLLFIGGVDQRRKVTDLVAAFNNLRARGENIKLVLAGDTMYGPATVPNVDLQKYFLNTSYIDDVIFMGFITREQRDWLYQHALAFIYPSIYEGFGLPVLEAMSYGCPVIAYPNSVTKEVAGGNCLYAENYQDIFDQVVYLLTQKTVVLNNIRLKGETQASRFSWAKTSKNILSILID